jgi:hypothetical protein
VKFLGCLILFAGASAAQLSPGVPPRSYLEIAASAVSAHVAWSQSLGMLESGDVRAAFTALAVINPMRAGQELRGVRVDLSIPDWNGVAYVQESDVPAMKKYADTLVKFAKEYPKATASFQTAGPMMDPVPPLFFSRQGSGSISTLYIGGPGLRSLPFTAVSPSDLAAIFARAIKTLKAH